MSSLLEQQGSLFIVDRRAINYSTAIERHIQDPDLSQNRKQALLSIGSRLTTSLNLEK